jgi:DNA polymerase III delta subunit
VLQSEAAQSALHQLRAANESEVAALHAVGKAYAALDRLEIDTETLQNSTSNAESALFGRIVPLFASRRKSLADHQLSAAMEQARAAAEAGDRKQALRALKAVQSFTEFASPDLKNEWAALTKKAEKGKVFGRLG